MGQQHSRLRTDGNGNYDQEGTFWSSVSLTAIVGKNVISCTFCMGVFPSLLISLHSITTKKLIVEWFENTVKWVNSVGFPPVSTWRATYWKCSPVSAFNSTQHFCTKALQEAGISSYSKHLSHPPVVGPCLPAVHGNGRLALAESYITSQLPTETSIQQLQDLNTDNKGSHRYSLFLFTFRLLGNSFYLVLLTLNGTLELLLQKKKKEKIVNLKFYLGSHTKKHWEKCCYFTFKLLQWL